MRSDRYAGLTAGVKVLLPVFQPGALLYLGQGYARQGDGKLLVGELPF